MSSRAPGSVPDARPTAAAASPWREVAGIAAVWLALLVAMLAFRGFLIWWFRAELSPEAQAEALRRCFTTGLRFDISVATYALLPASLATSIHLITPLGRWPGFIRRWTGAVALPACALAFVTDAAYFAEYHAQFNHWIFGLVFDDRSAIFSTIWSTYPVVWLLLLCAVAATGAAWGVERLSRAVSAYLPIPARLDGGRVRAVGAVVLVVLLIPGLRGSLGSRPVQDKDAATTGDAFLNKVVVNPFFALFSAIESQRRLQTSAGIRTFLPDGDIRAAARALFPERGAAPDLDATLAREARGAVEPRAKHIFVIVMESYDSWSMEPKYSSLHLTDRLAELGRSGIQAQAFVPAASGTILSLGAIMTGLPSAGLYVNYLPALRGGVPTAAPAIFHRLGYRTRFFYGGYLSWERVGDFARDLGFDDVYGGDKMSERLTGNEWGVDDDVLFRFVLDHTDDVPTFDVIMSTSYHPPYTVDVEAKGFDLEALRRNPLCRGLSAQQLRVFGHLWYADQSLGSFVQEAEQNLSRPLFALTGDHYSREDSIDPRPSLFEATAVPLVLYGRDALAHAPHPATLAGSHVDIVPTLVNLVAPEGFTYEAFGRDLLDPTQPQVGYGDGTVITPTFMFKVASPARIEDLQGQPLHDPAPTQDLALHYQRLHGMAWWRARNGAAWPD